MTDVDEQLRRAAAAFEQAYGRPPTHAAVAPGRVNLIGEHTDYNGGFVLPMAIERQAVLVAAPAPAPAPAPGRQARVRSAQVDGEAAFDVTADLAPGDPSWANYVKGAVKGCLDAGLDPGGFDAWLDSDVPAGGGLSSSAAIEVATATLMEVLSRKRLDPVDKALLAQHAEHTFAGVPCGIMDQFISAMGEAGHALLIDCRSHEATQVPLDDPGVAVLIINSNVKHELTGGEYAERRAQCERAAKALGVELLRDANPASLEVARAKLDEVDYRRARHVVTEDVRTLAAVEALRARNYPAVGAAMVASHASLRDDFEVSTPELDLLVELAVERDGVIGSRMTGGGFGGCTVTLVRADAAAAVADAVTAAYQQQTGIEPAAFVSRPAAGARPLALD